MCQEGLPKNRNPKPEEISRWLPDLLDEIDQCDPTIILGAGSIPSRVLGLPVPMNYGHGIPHRVTLCGKPRLLFPMYHPAAGLHNKGFIAAFYSDLQGLDGFRKGKVAPWAPAPRGWAVESLQDPLHGVDRGALVAVDTEGWASKPWGLSFSPDGVHAYVIRADDDRMTFWFDQWISDKAVCAHNGLYDVPVLAAMGVHLWRWEDTQVLAYHEMLRTGSGVLEAESQNLGTLAYRFCQMMLGELTDCKGVDFKTQTIPYTDEVLTYAGEDVIATYRLFEHLSTYAQDPVYRIDMGQILLVEEMIRAGLPFAVDDVADYYCEVIEKKALAVTDLRVMAARRGLRNFNPGSHPQVRALLQKYGLKVRKRTKGGQSSTNEKALAPHKAHEFVKRLQDYRELDKLDGTYLRPLMKELQ